MAVAIPNIANRQEIERLRLLIPDRLKHVIEVTSSVDLQSQSIFVQRREHHCCQIQIDSIQWHGLDIDVRNLLFWHEVARIDNGSIRSDRSEYMAISISLGIAALDLFTQNIGLLTTSLLVAGLAGFRLYQKHLGEQNLQRLTTADRDAIELAVKFGYERSTARDLLTLAIQITSRRSHGKFSRDRSATRLQVISLS
jgi:Protein of unknown function (DUF3318)